MSGFLEYLFWGLTIYVALVSAYATAGLLHYAVSRYSRRKELCDMCGINESEISWFGPAPDGLPKHMSLCRPCAIEAKELHEASARKDSDGLGGTEP